MQQGKVHSVSQELEKKILLAYSIVNYSIEEVRQITWDLKEEGIGDIDATISLTTFDVPFNLELIQIKTKPEKTNYWTKNNSELKKGFQQLFDRYLDNRQNVKKVKCNYTLLLQKQISPNKKHKVLKKIKLGIDETDNKKEIVKYLSNFLTFEKEIDKVESTILISEFVENLQINSGLDQLTIENALHTSVPDLDEVLFVLSEKRVLEKDHLKKLYSVKSYKINLENSKQIEKQIFSLFKSQFKLQKSLSELNEYGLVYPLDLFHKNNGIFTFAIPTGSVNIQRETPFDVYQIIDESENSYYVGKLIIKYRKNKVSYGDFYGSNPFISQLNDIYLINGSYGSLDKAQINVFAKPSETIIDDERCINLAIELIDHLKEELI